MRWLPLLATMGCMEYDQAGWNGTGLATVTDAGGGVPSKDELPPGWSLDGWDLPQGSSIDVIVYGDTSDSMTEELVTLGQTITPFVDRLAESVSDWQLAAVTGNDGCAVGGVLTPDMADYADRFAAGIVTWPADRDEDEMAFQNTAIAAERSGPGDCNDGLIRGGLLHLVFISDENDESPGFDGAPDYWKAYWDRIVAVHGDPFMITMSAVAGPTPNGCEGAEPGFGYDVAVAATGGEFLSICDDWASQIEVLADAGTVRDTFVLSTLPVPESIVVWIDGVEVPPAGRWSYEADRNAVVFSSDPPDPGERIDILYEEI